MSGLIYFNLTKNEHSINMNEKMQLSIFIDPFIFIFSRPTIIIAPSHGRITGSKDSAGLVANIQMNVNNNLLNYYSVILQDHIN